MSSVDVTLRLVKLQGKQHHRRTSPTFSLRLAVRHSVSINFASNAAQFVVEMKPLLPSLLLLASLSSKFGDVKGWAILGTSLSRNRPNSFPPSAEIFDASSLDWDWKGVADAAFENDSRPILLFDGICNFCNGAVNACIDWDVDEQYRYASLQSKTGQALLIRSGKHPNDLSSLVFVAPDKAYFESEAVLRTAQGLKGLPGPARMSARLMRKLVPKFARDALYHIVADNRYIFGELKECRIDWDGSLQKRFVEDPDPCPPRGGIESS
jgi:predicted DCC family thiol-disulfide oxidoreductase YuxK